MKPETIQALNNLKKFCLNNKCYFIRSTNSTNDLVLSVKIKPFTFEDVYFETDISFESIEHEFYTI